MWKNIKQRKDILVGPAFIDRWHFIYAYQVDPIWCWSWVSFILTGLGIALLVNLMLNFCKFLSSMITLEIFRWDCQHNHHCLLVRFLVNLRVAVYQSCLSRIDLKSLQLREFFFAKIMCTFKYLSQSIYSDKAMTNRCD